MTLLLVRDELEACLLPILFELISCDCCEGNGFNLIFLTGEFYCLYYVLALNSDMLLILFKAKELMIFLLRMLVSS